MITQSGKMMKRRKRMRKRSNTMKRRRKRKRRENMKRRRRRKRRQPMKRRRTKRKESMRGPTRRAIGHVTPRLIRRR